MRIKKCILAKIIFQFNNPIFNSDDGEMKENRLSLLLTKTCITESKEKQINILSRIGIYRVVQP